MHMGRCVPGLSVPLNSISSDNVTNLLHANFKGGLDIWGFLFAIRFLVLHLFFSLESDH